MKEKEEKQPLNKVRKTDVEFSNEINIGLDYNANLHPNSKEEINRVKEFYDSRL